MTHAKSEVVVAENGAGRYQQGVVAGRHRLIADEPAAVGGDDAGPAPFDYLLAALGAWFGWQMLPLIILLSSLVGAVVGISLMVFARHGRNVPIPFGPYLAAAGLIALFWGKPLTQAFMGVGI